MAHSQVFQIILERRSCRHYIDTEIPASHIDDFIEALRWAPSAGNRQPWHFYLIKNSQLKRGLVKAAYGQDFIAQAPVVFIVCALPGTSATRYGKRGRDLYVYQDTAAAVQNLLLTATSYGYGSCWVGAFNENEVGRALNLPEHHRPVAIVPIGKAAEHPQPPLRLNLNEVLTIRE